MASGLAAPARNLSLAIVGIGLDSETALIA